LLIQSQAEKRSKELSNEIEALRAEVGELHAKAKEAGDKAQDAFNHAARYTEVVESLKAALKNQEWHREHLADLSRDLKQRSESDEWLQNELDQFEERMKVHNQRQQEQVKRFEEVKRHIAQIRQNQSAKRVEIGKHEQRKATHEQKIKDRDLAIRQTAQQYRLRGYGMELDDTQINDFLEEIGRLSKEQTAKAEKARQDNIAEVRKIQSVLDDLREWRSALQEKRKSARESITGNERRIANLHVELRSITTDEGKKASIESNIGELEGKLRQSRQEFANGTWNHKIQQITAELRNLEDQGATLNRDLIQGTKQAGNLARLNHLRKELKDRQTSLDTMKAAHGDRLRAVLGRDWKAAKLEADFQSVLESKRGRVQEAERQRDEVNRELEQVEFKLKTAQTDMKRKRTELDRCATILKSITSGEPEEYPQVLQDLQESRDTRKDDVNGYSIMRKWFNECIETAKSDQPACRLCSRAFSDERSVRQFIKKLESKVSQGALKELQQELKEFEADLRKATNAGTTYDTWVRLSSKELPSIETEATKLDQARNDLLKRQEDHDKVISERQDDLRDVETLVKPVGNIIKYNADLESFKIQIDELVAKEEGTGSSRTLEDLQEEIEMVSSKSRSLRANQSKLQAEEQSARSQISTFEVEIGRLKNQLTTANNELEKKSRIVAQVNELRDSNTSQRDAISELDKKLQDLTPRFLEEEAKLEDVKQRGNAKEKELQGEATKLAETVRNLRRANHEIQEYIQGGGLTKLERCQREIQSFENEIALLEEEQRQITIEVNKIKEELSSHDQNKRVINDNLRFRRTKRDLEVVNAQIEELSAQNAEADQEKWRRQAERFQRQYNLLTTEETSKMGTMKAKDDQLGGLIRDWETDYKDAEIKYKKSHIEVEVSKLPSYSKKLLTTLPDQ
jgi:DNA repair protein RAD50